MRQMLVLLSLVLAPLWAGTVTRTAQFDQIDLVITSKDGFDNIELRGGVTLTQPGSPRVPRVVEALVIPSGATPVRVELTGEEWVTLPGTYKVGPAQPDFPLPQPGKTRTPTLHPPNPAIYGSSEAYPKTVAMLTGSGTWAGYRIAHVELHPVRYIPTTGELQVASKLSYKLEYAGGASAVVATERQQAEFGDMVRTLVVNPNDVKRCAPQVRPATSFALPPGRYEYVVITDSIMDTVFARLADWKTQKGVPGTVVRTGYIYANYTGYDNQEKIRNFIKDAYATWGTMYVLLGGQGDYQSTGQNVIPTRMANYDGNGDEPCDLYYAGLDGNWDRNNNRVYGEVPDSADMYSDVYVGRAPVYTVAMARNFVNKVLKYEQNPPTGFLKEMILPTAILWSSYNELPMQESIARMTPGDWRDQRLYERAGTLSRQAMRDSLNTGVGMGQWSGHGDENGIYMGSQPYFNSADADAMTNGDKQGMVIAIACDNAAWDWVPNGDCFAEHLVNRVGGGFIAAIMNTRYGYGAINQQGQYVVGPSERLDTTFFAGVFYYRAPHTGQALGRAKACWAPYADSLWQYDMQRYCIYGLNLIGDPETRLWTAEPTPVNVAHAGVVNIGNNVPYPVTVMTALDAPVESAMVCLQKGNEVDLKGWTNASGQVTLYVSATTPGPMFMAVNARDHHVFCDTVQVIASTRYVSYLRSSILDPGPGGNGDSILNPGETVKIPTWVKNWGQETANSVTAKLRTHDANAQITDSTKSFGNIAAGDSAYTGADGFGLHVNSGLANGYAVVCSLICRDALDSTWVSYVTFFVGAPVLGKQAVTVVDSAHGGNNNGRIDPNETADLMVRIGNSGMGHGYNCHALLRSGDARFMVSDSTADYGYIRASDSASNASDLFTIYADGTIPPETPIACTLYYYADGGYVKSEPLTIIVGELRQTDPAPDGPRNPPRYYAYDDGDVLYAPHPTYNWVEVNSVGTRINYSQNDDVALVPLPSGFGPLLFYGQRFTQISVSADGWICPGNHLTKNYANRPLPCPTDTTPGMVCANWDDLYPVSGGGGAGNVYYYHDADNHRFVIEYDSVRYYSGSNRDKFELIIYDTTVATYTGDNAILVQYMTANGYSSSTAGLEDPSETIAIQCLYNGAYHKASLPIEPGRAVLYTTDPPFPAGVADEHGPAGVPNELALSICPNPLRTGASVSWALPAPGRVSVKLYDASGRVVRSLATNNMEAGRHSVTWDGRAENGKRVAEGIYFCQLATERGTQQQKLVVTR
ncbi:T9SS type A sorting domain-containing protein [candidate division WOR-3 bacterium]|nr:T9SS type A sorting domain-containing protein [candidate division WOR-3 bacterium]